MIWKMRMGGWECQEVRGDVTVSERDVAVRMVTLPQDVWDLIDAEADRSGRTDGVVIEQVIRHTLSD